MTKTDTAFLPASLPLRCFFLGHPPCPSPQPSVMGTTHRIACHQNTGPLGGWGLVTLARHARAHSSVGRRARSERVPVS